MLLNDIKFEFENLNLKFEYENLSLKFENLDLNLKILIRALFSLAVAFLTSPAFTSKEILRKMNLVLTA